MKTIKRWRKGEIKKLPSYQLYLRLRAGLNRWIQAPSPNLSSDYLTPSFLPVRPRITPKDQFDPFIVQETEKII